MSGKFYTELRLQRQIAERFARAALVRRIEANRAIGNSAIAAIEELLQRGIGISESRRDVYRRLIAKMEQPELVSEDKPSALLKELVEKSETLAAQSQSQLDELTAHDTALNVAAKLSQVRALIRANGQHCEEWFPGRGASWEGELGRGKKLISEDRLEAARGVLARVESDIRQCAEDCLVKSAQHLTRKEVVKKLRKTLHSLGFVEVSPPSYEVSGDKRSSIRFSVRSAGHGERTLTLALGENELQTSGHGTDCQSYLSQLSDLLAQAGVATSFRPGDGRQPDDSRSQVCTANRKKRRQSVQLMGSAAQ